VSSIYIHIPFCERKCNYCDFYSIENHEGVQSFLAALTSEIDLSSRYFSEEPVETIYIGGGTPSILDPEDVRKILKSVSGIGDVKPDAEVTIEVNPGTIDEQKLESYRAMGINRLSIGVQSFYQDDLRFLSRIHSVNQGEDAIRMARRCGFENISIDLIYSLPTQTVSKWKHILKRAIEFELQHISAYSLIVEAGTPLKEMIDSNIISPVPDDIEAAMYELTMGCLADAGYEQYEVSNYAKAGYKSRHNSNYWNHSNYLGFGPSAHSFWKNKRWWNFRDMTSYEKAISGSILPVQESEILETAQLLDESLMLGLRTGKLNLRAIKDRFNVELNEQGKHYIEELAMNGFISLNGSQIELTNSGYLISDAITEKLSTCFV